MDWTNVLHYYESFSAGDDSESEYKSYKYQWTMSPLMSACIAVGSIVSFIVKLRVRVNVNVNIKRQTSKLDPEVGFVMG